MQPSYHKKGGFPVNHFIMIPFEDQSFIQEYDQFTNNIISCSPKDFDENLLQKKGKLHMSVVVFNLDKDPAKVDKVKSILSSIENEMKQLAKPSITFNFEKFDTLGEMKEARVLYAKMLEDENFDRLNKVIHLIISKLIDNGIIDKSKLDEMHIQKEENMYKVLLHLTLLNITFLNKVLGKQKKKKMKNFNANGTMNFIQNIKLPPCSLQKINFCVMREDKQTEKYELVQSYNLI